MEFIIKVNMYDRVKIEVVLFSKDNYQQLTKIEVGNQNIIFNKEEIQ